VPRLAGLAPARAGLVDHAGQPGRVGRLRRLRGGRLHQPGDRSGARRRAGRHPDPDRRRVLPDRFRAAAARTHRGTRRPGRGPPLTSGRRPSGTAPCARRAAA
jgi:hypothetical protein